ncbi:MAG: molybdopterin molybdotransferase MoeA, partial [Beijerinckiaceae bacterium]
RFGAILATGDELVRPGAAVGADQIVLSNTYAITALVEDAGGIALDCGIAADTPEALQAALKAAQARHLDVLITTGGASVGERDFVRAALAQQGMDLNFWKIAMRPGKPLLHGTLGDVQVLGLPGNPVSSFVCTLIFLVPLIRALLGRSDAMQDRTLPARLAVPMPANDLREDYVRAGFVRDADGVLLAHPADRQDSSMLRTLAEADGLLIRPVNAPAAEAGDPCRVLPFTL